MVWTSTNQPKQLFSCIGRVGFFSRVGAGFCPWEAWTRAHRGQAIELGMLAGRLLQRMTPEARAPRPTSLQEKRRALAGRDGDETGVGMVVGLGRRVVSVWCFEPRKRSSPGAHPAETSVAIRSGMST